MIKHRRNAYAKARRVSQSSPEFWYVVYSLRGYDVVPASVFWRDDYQGGATIWRRYRHGVRA